MAVDILRHGGEPCASTFQSGLSPGPGQRALRLPRALHTGLHRGLRPLCSPGLRQPAQHLQCRRQRSRGQYPSE